MYVHLFHSAKKRSALDRGVTEVRMTALSRAATREFIKKHAIPYDMLSIRARFPHFLSKKGSPFCANYHSENKSLPPSSPATAKFKLYAYGFP